MYAEFFHLKEPPFSITPDPRFLYMSERHREAFAHLLYGVENQGGFVLLTGEVGTGKTTVCRCLLEQLPPGTEVALILNPRVSAHELLASICDELRISYPRETTSVKVLVDALNSFLLAAHAQQRTVALVIDEAQNLTPEVLEQVRLLTNLETPTHKLLQIIMLGQPELLEILSQPGLRQLAQRITARYHLGPLSREETAAYVRHRLAVAGTQQQLFPARVLAGLHILSGGTPRVINALCDRALLGAYAQGKPVVEGRILQQAAREVLGRPARPRRARPAFLAAGTAAAVLALAVAGWRLQAVPDLAARLVDPAPDLAAVATTLTSPPAVASPEEAPGTGQSAAGAAEVPPAESTDLAWTGDETAALGLDQAFAALFSLWGLDYDPKGPAPCRQAEALGLACLVRQGRLSDLAQLDRPAVLWLIGDDGAPLFTTLAVLDGEEARVSFGGAWQALPSQDLLRRWSGSYTVLWQPPPDYQDSIRPGHQGTDVAWLDRRLAQLFQRPPRSGQIQTYDEELAAQVRRFQEQQGLVADGIAGVQTIIRLEGALSGQGPFLRPRRE
ncbi:MAG: AAA family ATPase [Thermodesulfobacteriota bacterium]